MLPFDANNETLKNNHINQINRMIWFMEAWDDVTDYRTIPINVDSDLSALPIRLQTSIANDLYINEYCGFFVGVTSDSNFYYCCEDTYILLASNDITIEFLAYIKNYIFNRCSEVLLERKQLLEDTQKFLEDIS